MYIQTSEEVDKEKIENLINNYMINCDYLSEILKK